MSSEEIDFQNFTHNQNVTTTAPLYSMLTTDGYIWQKSPALAFLLCAFAAATIVGNALVMAAVVCRPNLHSPTGYLVLSLAFADLIVGLAVMPLNIVMEMRQQWLYGLAVCDIWHSLDVLASTASIWNLCVIAVDRCLAVSDPLNYPELMTVKRVAAAIGCVWLVSAVVSFPAVAWWRSASPQLYENDTKCEFTDDIGYLTFSSLVSFYAPLLIIIFAYARVYTIATRHQKSVSSGRQALPCNPSLYMRVHRGGGGASKTTSPLLERQNSKYPSSVSSANGSPPLTSPNAGNCPGSASTIAEDIGSILSPFLASFRHKSVPRKTTDCSYQNSSTVDPVSESESVYSTNASRKTSCWVRPGDAQEVGSQRRRRKHRPSMLSRLLAKESKAAKTLGIVVGCFVACWLPFFLVNVLYGICRGGFCSYLDGEAFQLTFTVVTWLGHCNSFLNPVIYTCFNNEFRDAFAYVICLACWTKCGRRYATSRRRYRHLYRSQHYGAKRGLARAIENHLKVMVPQATNNDTCVIVNNTIRDEESLRIDSGIAHLELPSEYDTSFAR